jgi:putative toxin-antitoxin system antitoxin component (TIGR02293 family)
MVPGVDANSNAAKRKVSGKAQVTARAFADWSNAVRKMSPGKKIAMIREGIDVEVLIGAGQYYGIPQARLSRLIGVSQATVTRKVKAGGRLSPQESERLARMASVEAEAEEVFDSQDLARRWMLEPNLALGEAPLSLLDTDAGADEVKKVLASIAHGGVA